MPMVKPKQFCTEQVIINNYGERRNCGKQAKFRLRFSSTCTFCTKHAKEYNESQIVDIDHPIDLD
jgi:hypothetical protein